MIDQDLLAESIGRLDAGTRALLDLSLRRAIPDEQVASVLGVEPASIPPRRARGIAQLADMMEIPGPAELAALLIAIPDLPDDAWGVPQGVPFPTEVSRARRARAFRRVAVAASPLVALGAVMAAVLVSTNQSSGPSSRTSAQVGAGGSASGRPQVAIAAPEPRHGLPAGVQLTLARPAANHGQHAAAQHGRGHRRAPAAPEHAVLARQPSHAPHTEHVVFHPAPVVHEKPRHVTHHHAPAAPRPAPAPNKPHPSTPAPKPAPAPQNQTVQVSAPVTHPNKPPASTVNLHPPGGGAEREGDDHAGKKGGGGKHHGPPHAVPVGHGGRGNNWSPPGLFKKRH